MEDQPTHIEQLKYFGAESIDDKLVVELRLAMEDKGYDITILKKMLRGGRFAPYFKHNILRLSRPSYDLEDKLEELAVIAFNSRIDRISSKPKNRSISYIGKFKQNRNIDESIASSPYNEERYRIGRGAATHFSLGNDRSLFIDSTISMTPIVILGGGVSGAMITRTLSNVGFRNLLVIDNTGEYGGIWNYNNVVNLSRNNPKTLEFLGLRLHNAPGPGREVKEFIRDLQIALYPNIRLPIPIKGKFYEIEPGDLDTVVYYENSGEKKSIISPIVINTLGIGKPLSISKEGWMSTSATAREAGPRWQQIIDRDRAEKYKDKRLIFIGLGNSTAEMLVQLKNWRENGYNIDYRVLTHYPIDALMHPSKDVYRNGRKFRLFRDLDKPDLVDLAGDLGNIRDAYFESLRSGKIISDVKRWDVDDGKIYIKQNRGKVINLEFEQIFTLIGYRHEKEDLEKMGLVINPDTFSPYYDYDGEFQRKPGALGRERVFAGYFGLGPILKSPENENAIVIPGNIFRIPDLLFGVLVRAYEYQHKNKELKKPLENNGKRKRKYNYYVDSYK